MADDSGSGHKDPCVLQEKTENTQEQNGTDRETGEENSEKVEITQTDHLNRRLLSSFLDRINQLDASGGFPVVARIDTTDPEDDLDLEYAISPQERADNCITDSNKVIECTTTAEHNAPDK